MLLRSSPMSSASAFSARGWPSLSSYSHCAKSSTTPAAFCSRVLSSSLGAGWSAMSEGGRLHRCQFGATLPVGAAVERGALDQERQRLRQLIGRRIGIDEGGIDLVDRVSGPARARTAPAQNSNGTGSAGNGEGGRTGPGGARQCSRTLPTPCQARYGSQGSIARALRSASVRGGRPGGGRSESCRTSSVGVSRHDQSGSLPGLPPWCPRASRRSA